MIIELKHCNIIKLSLRIVKMMNKLLNKYNVYLL